MRGVGLRRGGGSSQHRQRVRPGVAKFPSLTYVGFGCPQFRRNREGRLGDWDSGTDTGRRLAAFRAAAMSSSDQSPVVPGFVSVAAASVYRSFHERAVWFNPGNKDKIVLSACNQLRDLFMSLARCRLSPADKARCLWRLAKVAKWNLPLYRRELAWAWRRARG